MTRNVAAIALLAVALVGVGVFFPAACDKVKVYDVSTGSWRPMTRQDANTAIGAAAAVGTTVAVATGHAEWVPIVDLVVRLAALLSAWAFTNPWQQKATTQLAVAAAKNGNGPAPPGG
jgi:hypothetical protein